MALIECPECNKKVSNQAESCIHCGCPLKNKKKTEKKAAEKRIESKSKKTQKNNKNQETNAKKFLIIILIIVVVLLLILFGIGNMNQVKIPFVNDTTEETAITILQNNNLIPIVEYEYSDEVDEGKVLNTSPENGKKVKKNSNVYITISKGPRKIESQDATITWYNVGYSKDKWEFSSPYIEEGYLIIECNPTFQTGFTWKSGGFGNASINDTFNKTVPVDIEYENQTVTANVEQPIKLKVSVNDLDVKKPTTLYMKLIIIDNNDIEKDLKVNFSISW